jgi:hypothetical protein
VRGFTPLHWACESREPARLLETLRGGAARDACARCGANGAGPTALELTTLPDAFTFAPPLVRAEPAALVRAALAPWSPRTHRVQTAVFRRAAFAVMCVGQRLRGPAPASADGHERRRSRRLDLTRAPPCPGLPDELWMAVLACCGRGWWTA